MISCTGRPINLPWYLEPVIGPVITKKVAGIFSLSITGKAFRNWFREASSYVIDTAAFLPYCHLVISVVPDWPKHNAALQLIAIIRNRAFRFVFAGECMFKYNGLAGYDKCGWNCYYLSIGFVTLLILNGDKKKGPKPLYKFYIRLSGIIKKLLGYNFPVFNFKYAQLIHFISPMFFIGCIYIHCTCKIIVRYNRI